MVSREAFQKKINSIPHLRLPLNVNIEDIRSEIQHSIGDDYVSYESKNKLARALYRKVWKCRSFVGNTANSREAGDGYNVQNFIPTELLEQCPYINKLLLALNRHLLPSRASLIISKGNLTWHSHVLNGQPEHILTVHVPVSIPDKFEYCVTSRTNIVNRIPVDDKLIHRKNYQAGSMWVFNSYHWHNVYNRSDEPRISIMTYINTNRDEVRYLVEKAIDKHDAKEPVIE